MLTVEFDGCMLGLEGPGNIPVKKPWRVATTSIHVIEAFSGLKCRGHEQHLQCRGKICKASERYTPRFAARVHRATARMAVEAIEGKMFLPQ